MMDPLLPLTSLDELFPFGIVTGRDGIIVHTGRSMTKLCGKPINGLNVSEILDVLSPTLAANLRDLETLRDQQLVLVIKTVNMQFKGLMTIMGSEDNPLYLLAITPFFTDVKLARGSGLEFRDFAKNDPIFDFLMLVQSERRARELSREAQSLAEAHAVELEKLNKQLHLEIKLREKIAHELNIAKGIAEDANVAKSNFLANMSHEIRTPLNGIIGLTSVLATTPLAPEQKLFVDNIRTSGNHLNLLVNDILDFSKFEGGFLTLEDIPTRLRVLFDDIQSMMSESARAKGLPLIFDIATDLALICDPMRIKQVLINLIGNAIKFTESGQIQVSVNAEPHATDRVKLTAVIRDTGIGIPEKNLELLFKPFTQGDASLSRRFGGTGLGLAICKLLAESMGGHIQCKSTLGEGSEFTVVMIVKSAEPKTQSSN